jgi:hypothetical protein
MREVVSEERPGVRRERSMCDNVGERWRGQRGPRGRIARCLLQKEGLRAVKTVSMRQEYVFSSRRRRGLHTVNRVSVGEPDGQACGSNHGEAGVLASWMTSRTG